MTRAACILNKITKELDRRQHWLESEPGLMQVLIRVRLDKKSGKVRFVQLTTDAETEYEERAA